MARWLVVRIFLRFAAFYSLWPPVSRHIAFLPQCRMGAVCPPLFFPGVASTPQDAAASWGKREDSGAAGDLRFVRPWLFCFQRSAVFSFLHAPLASSFLSPRFIPLLRVSFDPTSGSYRGALTRQSTFSRLPAFLRRPDRPGPPGTSSSEPPEHPTSRFLNLLISQPPKSQPVESGSALRASLPRWRCRCESVGRLGASLPP